MTTTLQRRRRHAGESAERSAAAWEAGDEARIGAAEGETRLVGVVIGTVVGIAPEGAPLVDHPHHDGGALTARSVVAIDAALVGREVALMFERGDPGKPVVMGVLQPPSAPSQAPDASAGNRAPPREVEVDGERLTLTAEREIVFRCGRASITLTRAGKVLIKGEFVLTQAGGVNRIRGGSVQIN